MASTPPPDVDPRRVRLGLVILSVTVLAALAVAILVDDALARLIMVGIVVFAVVRTWLLLRSERARRG